MSLYEAKPTRSPVERVVSRLSVQTVRFRDIVSGGRPEYTASDFAAAAAGIVDPIGKHLIGVLTEDAQSLAECVEALNRIGWVRWFDDQRKASIDRELHHRLCVAAVGEYQRGEGWPIRDLKKVWRCGAERVRELMPHYLTLGRILADRHQQVARHLAARLRRSA